LVPGSSSGSDATLRLCADGRLIAIYYWAAQELAEPHIAATVQEA